MLQTSLEPLMRVAKAHARGKEEYARSVVHDLLEQFAIVEEKFQQSNGLTTEQELIDSLRKVRPTTTQAPMS